MKEIAKPNDVIGASIGRNSALNEVQKLEGRYHVVCKDKDGNVKWQDDIENLIVTVGKNLMLDSALAGSSYTVTGPFMGLISSVGYSAIVVGDTMASHGGWTEAGGTNAPTYSGTRKTAAWSAAAGGAKSLSAGLVFNITGTGTVKGAFIVFGTGAVNTIDNTSGVLYSAGLFSGGDKSVVNTDTLTVSYTTTLT